MYRYLFVALAAVITTTAYFKYSEEPDVHVREQTTLVPIVEILIERPPEPVSSIDYDQLECLALNVYHEARGESIDGQVAVSQVVMNRVNSKRFPNSICEVVYQGQVSTWYMETKGEVVPLRDRCQFSWWCDGRSDAPRDMRAWGQALTVAASVMRNEYPDIVQGAMWYHANYVNPGWRHSMVKIAVVGDHQFYRDRGF